MKDQATHALQMPASLINGLHNGAEVQKESLIRTPKTWLAKGSRGLWERRQSGVSKPWIDEKAEN